MDVVGSIIGWIANIIQIATAVFAIAVLLSTRRRLTQWMEKQKQPIANSRSPQEEGRIDQNRRN